MFISTVTSKGQLTLPASIRKNMRIKTSDKVIFIREGKRIFIQKLLPISSLFGALSNPGVTPLPQEEMDKLLERGIFEKQI
ncbi:hypothetical protein A3D01_01080 [Candidatus Woesebacteria bacterium RIFCSPHIGHO2_02_FULL_39_13]|uniref:SpoVT-AbrB domain-containing protein n=1 Tax=Candidatus Woesebacteria bacterium RIFCSPHIGHO2_02_FULL_39_13 TaxID=1802505 RepID=A0A1F7YZV3_9BACT|nr:MAG: hypothetical protein A3D01_01080 [Candidatus Woesebacteria bacterium RIFCSPHIGHO2_02_FULL_39_13]OGM74365.1 MAG: hypothetical protein A3H19_01930 [Candidatus Woesebacteria bacterium RIFCSPLOWO2_12_FULL_39_9]